MTEGARRGSREEPRWAQTTGPTAPFASFSSRTPSSRKPKPQRGPHEGLRRLCGAENTREKRALRRAGIRGNSLPEGDIDAIAIVIERDIISTIIIIISTIYTAITTAAPRHRYNDKDDTPDKEEVEEEPKKHAKNKKYTKEDFIAEKHGAVIDCNKGMVTFNVDDKEHTVYFPKRIDKVYGVNTISNVKTIKVGTIDCPIYEPKEEYQTLVIGSISIQYKKRKMKKFKFGDLFKKGTTSTGRPSRASTQIRRSYNEDIIAPSFAPEEDNGAPNASSFPCYDFLTNAGILDDFFTLVNRAGLATYVGDEREQYHMLTKIFVESFKFHNTQYEPTVAFKIYGNPVTMELEEFCRALDIAPVGTARRIDDNPRDLLELYRGITEDDCRTIQRGKIRNIQLPAIKYFAYYIATSILGRENTSNISSYHLAFLNAALTGQTPYHLGSLIARRLSSRGPIFGGTIALRILTHLRLPLDSNDVPLTPRRLDIAAMKSHHFVTTDSTIDNMVYRMLFADGNEKEIPLPQPGLFNIDRQSWSLTKEEVEEHMKIQDFHSSMTPRTPSPPTTAPSHTPIFLQNNLRRRYTETPLHGGGNELHLGQKPKLGGELSLDVYIFTSKLTDLKPPKPTRTRTPTRIPTLNLDEFLF
ncbi:hypothetical protein QYE76_061097 [Lolium multiflorum]|uniref:Arabidopsis retrotransposon Orf1 C-terminal domain-containing protein n=1 Tax=Lolium multiflorum TaxID=4521 RepID=A0AAD8W758_LOLMU|nr:hypothetical protein QYE76_061097 [Lolium multiflorum]